VAHVAPERQGQGAGGGRHGLTVCSGFTAHGLRVAKGRRRRHRRRAAHRGWSCPPGTRQTTRRMATLFREGAAAISAPEVPAVDVSSAPNASTRICVGESDRSAQGLRRSGFAAFPLCTAPPHDAGHPASLG
jgi:hypothetical protein